MFGRIWLTATVASLACAGRASAITSTITQADGETPSRTVTVTLPPGFSPNIDNTLGLCSAFQEASVTCPAESQMGNASATISAFGLVRMLSGPVYFGGPGSAPGPSPLIVV